MAGAFVFLILFYLLFAFSLYGTFQKAGIPTWYAFVPIVNAYGIIKASGRPGWWLVLLIIPIVSLIVWIIVLYDLSTAFGHGVGFTLGLLFLNLIFFYVLSYGSSQYRGQPAMPPGAAPNPLPS